MFRIYDQNDFLFLLQNDSDVNADDEIGATTAPHHLISTGAKVDDI